MFKQFSCLTLAYSLTLISVYGDSSEVTSNPPSPAEGNISSLLHSIELPNIENLPANPHFSSFTGKVKAKKVRMRAYADLESPVIKELNRDELIIIVGEKGDFYAVEAPSGIKAYVARQFILDGTVEGNRVNVRLYPSLDAPIIGHLNQGESIQGVVSSINNKWFEIPPPAGTRFYIAKDYIESIGSPELKAQIDKRRHTAEQLLDTALLLTKAEMKKPYEEMDIHPIKLNYQTVINDYIDFPDLCEKAKDAYHLFQEEYTQRKIAYLETIAQRQASIRTDSSLASQYKIDPDLSPTDRMKMWEPIEQSLYIHWAALHNDQSLEDFYQHQHETGIFLTGIVEPYRDSVKRKPGDFFLKEQDKPVGYLYSTHVNLQELVGKKVTLYVSPRPNNNFAFPAYFVLSAE